MKGIRITGGIIMIVGVIGALNKLPQETSDYTTMAQVTGFVVGYLLVLYYAIWLIYSGSINNSKLRRKFYLHKILSLLLSLTMSIVFWAMFGSLMEEAPSTTAALISVMCVAMGIFYLFIFISDIKILRMDFKKLPQTIDNPNENMGFEDLSEKTQ